MASIIPVTVVIPVKNEEKNLLLCLKNLSIFSQVIVVDSGSTDSTPAIAREANVEFVDFKWNGLFPKKRNWVLRNNLIKSEWVLFLDADEFLTEGFIRELKIKLNKSRDVNGYWVTYQNYFMGRKIVYGDPMRKLSLFRVGKGEYEKIDETSWTGLDMEVHEHPLICGNIGRIESPIDHHDYKGYEAYLARHNSYSTWEARRFCALNKFEKEKLNARQRVKYFLMNSWFLGPLYFLYSYFLQFGFLDGLAGLLLALNKMIYFFQIKVKINEIRHGRQINKL